MNRLTAAGLLVVHDGRFSLTAEAGSIRRRSPSKAVYDRTRWLQETLPTDGLENAGTAWRLDGREYARATAAYHDRASAVMNKLYRDRS